MPEQKAPAVGLNPPSTKHLLMDARFAGLLAEDFDLNRNTILRALCGEPCKWAIAICEWVSTKDDPAGALLAWSRKHHKGQHRRCHWAAGTPPERPRVRRRCTLRNHPAPRRGSAPSAGAAVDSLRGVRVNAEALADRLEV